MIYIPIALSLLFAVLYILEIRKNNVLSQKLITQPVMVVGDKRMVMRLLRRTLDNKVDCSDIEVTSFTSSLDFMVDIQCKNWEK